jgi:predicted esterase
MRSLAVVMLIVLAVTPAAAETPPRGEFVEGLSCASDPSQTYTLYLPSSYDPERRWPVLMVFDPRGRSVMAAELFREAAEDYGWVIISSDNTRSDTESDFNTPAVNALWPEIQTRYSPDNRRVYTAGFSGTVAFSGYLGQQTGALAGVIATGGLFVEKAFKDTSYALFGAAGTADFNYREMRLLDGFLAEQGNPHRLEFFDGAHTWMPVSVARQAVEWMELQAMRLGTRPKDDALVARLYAADLAAGEELEAAGDTLGAHRRYEAIVRSFEGLGSVDEAKNHAHRLAAGPELERARKNEKKWDRYEVRRRKELDRTILQIEAAGTSQQATMLVRELRIDDLLERAAIDGPEGQAAGRLLSSTYAATSYYMVRKFFAADKYGHAEAVLEVASQIRDDSPGVWYNLACARARSDKKPAALEALERAVELGFTDLEHIESDPDLESLHREEGYQAIVHRLRNVD